MKSKFLSIGILIVLILGLVACTQTGTSSEPTVGKQPVMLSAGGGVLTGQITQGLVVVGTGSVSAEPEVAQVTFGVELRGDDVAAIVDEAADKINRAIAAAKDLGVAEDDIQTASYSLWVETLYNPETGTPTGEVVYHVSHYVQAALRDLNRVGDLLAAVVEAGANTISGVTFSVEDPGALVEQARQQALQNAQAQAKAMADTLGISLGKPTLVTETSSGYPVLESFVGKGGGGAVAAPSITPGAFSVSVSVQVVYEIR
ncbi:MAG: SIMPL domain-containing protein [Anaerolineae bacterium]|nr:SIMPL domain-containing protein [Anaerolineae bacterium]